MRESRRTAKRPRAYAALALVILGLVAAAIVRTTI